MSDTNSITDEQIETAYIIIAKIIRDYGDRYIPIFKRVHDERERRKADMRLKNIALQVAENLVK